MVIKFKPFKKSKVKKRAKKQKSKGSVIRFPANLLVPVARFLKEKLKVLMKRKKSIATEDPFTDPSRVMDNASPDTDAAEQYGHARTSAIKDQLDRRIIQTKKALTSIKLGKYGICEDCGEMIDTDRLMIYPEATICARDAKKREK